VATKTKKNQEKKDIHTDGGLLINRAAPPAPPYAFDTNKLNSKKPDILFLNRSKNYKVIFLPP
jgi:hypothetical protein